MPVEVILPRVDMAMETGTIEAWKVSEGDVVREGDALFEIGTDKAVMEVEAPAAGTVRGIAAPAGAVLPVGTVVAWICREGEDLPAAADRTPHGRSAPAAVTGAAPGAAAADTSRTGTAASAPKPSLRATPLARRVARQLGIDLRDVAGTGPRGRIGERDVLLVSESRASGTAPRDREPPQVARAPMPDAADEAGPLVPFSTVRRIIADRLSESARTAPHFFLTAHMDMSALIALQERIAPLIERRCGARPGLTVLLARIVGHVLPDHPLVNASLEGDAARLHRSAHIGIAMERDGDLVVPVLRDAHARNLADLTRDYVRLRDAVRARTVTPSDLRGGTFTISNLGMYGVDAFTAIINPPESAILAVGRVSDTPAGRNGGVVLIPQATFCLSSDHRIVDGVTAARFMADLREAIEHPEVLL